MRERKTVAREHITTKVEKQVICNICGEGLEQDTGGSDLGAISAGI